MADLAKKLNSKPKTVQELAEQTNSSVDSVRKQISALIADGKAKFAGHAATGKRGRPAKTYVAA